MDQNICQQGAVTMKTPFSFGIHGDCFDVAKNKDTYIDDKMKVYKDLYARTHLPKTIKL